MTFKVMFARLLYMKNLQQGSAKLWTIIIIVIIVVGVSTYFYYVGGKVSPEQSAVSTTQNQPGNNTYINKVYNYSLVYPKNYQIIDNEFVAKVLSTPGISTSTKELFAQFEGTNSLKEGDILIGGKLTPQSTYFDSVYSLAKIDLGGKSFEDYLQSLKTNLNGWNKYDISWQENTITIDGISALQFSTKFENKEVQGQTRTGEMILTIFQHGGNYFEFDGSLINNTSTVNEMIPDNYINTYQSILKSIAFSS